ncbi:MAG: DedA family protein [Bacteroidetes bacterium]|nr:DedA family protein [bacterium]NBP64006.1 DedA family protein [Bacteroidota bacterium]
MDFASFIDIFLHLDKHLADLSIQYGMWIYGILTLIVFCETGLVVTPFLPGDSLLFAIGALCAGGTLNPLVIAPLLLIAAISGDNVNYALGRTIGNKAFSNPHSKVFRRSYLEKTQSFYTEYGTKTIVMARFIPIVRTFAPFVAGIGSMRYVTFLTYSIAGGMLWIVSLITAGYYFGTIEIVKKNFSIVVLAIIFISILPAIIEAIKQKRSKQQV